MGRPGDVSEHADLGTGAVCARLALVQGPGGGRQLQPEVHGDQGVHRFDAKDVDDVLSGGGVPPGREQDHPLALGGLLRDGKLDARLDAGVLVEEADDLAPFPLDVSLQLSAADRQAAEEVLHEDGGAPLSRDDTGALELPRGLELEPGRARDLLLGARHDGEAREGAERGQGLASEAKGLQGREVIVARQLGGVVLQGEGFVVMGRDAGAIVLDLDGVETLVLEAHLFAHAAPPGSAGHDVRGASGSAVRGAVPYRWRSRQRRCCSRRAPLRQSRGRR